MVNVTTVLEIGAVALVALAAIVVSRATARTVARAIGAPGR